MDTFLNKVNTYPLIVIYFLFIIVALKKAGGLISWFLVVS